MNRALRPTALPAAYAVVLSLVFAAWLDFSDLHRLHDSDSFLPIFVSLERWTPFFWGQNRFGMLVPWLAQPIGDPLGNLLFQVALRLLALAGACYLLARSVAPPKAWFAVGTLALVTVVWGAKLSGIALLQTQPYSQEIALGLGGCLLIERARGRAGLAVGAALVLLAGWISLTLPGWLVPLLLLRRAKRIADGGAARWLAGVAAVGLSFAVNILFSRFSPVHGTDYALLPPTAWLRGLPTLASGATAMFWRPSVATLGAAAIVAVLQRRAPVNEARPTRWASSAVTVLVAAAVVFLAALSTSAWVAANGYMPRYTVAASLMLALAPASILVSSCERFAWGVDIISVVGALALLVGLAVVARPKSLGLPNRILASSAASVRAVEDLHCTHLLGDYWRAWPLAFAVVSARGNAVAPPLWVLSDRSEATRGAWTRAWPEARVCGLASDADRPRLVRALALPAFIPQEPRDGIELLGLGRPTAPP